MAAKTDIVRVSYRDLENIAQKRDESRDLGQGQPERKDGKHQKRQRQKRPTRGIYQPPSILRHKQQLNNQSPGEDWNGETEVGQEAENWDEEIDSHGSTSSSKENSVEKEVEAVLSSVRNLQVQTQTVSPQFVEERKTEEYRKDLGGPTVSEGRKLGVHLSQGDGKRRSKRPEMQRYVPKGKILHEQNQQEDEEERDYSDESAVFTSSPRKVDVEKSDGLNMKVTFTVAKSDGVPQTGIAPRTVQESHAKSRTGSDSSTADTVGQRPKVVGEEIVEKAEPKGQFSGNRNKPHWERGNRQGDGPSGQRKFGQDSRRQGHGQKVQHADRSGEKMGGRQARQSESWDDQYGTWPREKDKSKGNKKPSPQKRTDNWEASDVPVDSPAEFATAQVPKPQRTQQRKPRGGGVTRVAKQTAVSVTDSPDEPDNCDNNVIPTMIFERRSSASSLTENLGNGNNNLKQKPPKGQTPGKSNAPKRYSLSTLRRPRAGSVSSDVSTASDLSIDEETTTRILDWDKEVEREMAKQVQDETLKLKEFLEKQGDFPGWDFEISTENKDEKRPTDRITEFVDNSGFASRASERAYRPSQAKEKQFAERKKQNSGSSDRQYEGDRSEHWYSNEGNRSRRKDKRRNSANGRRSRDSSVSSVHSVQSYHGDEEMYHTWSLPRKGRRRRRSSNASLKDLSSSRDLLNDPESPNLQVTFAQNEQKRQVIVQNQNTGNQGQSGQTNHNQGLRGQGHRGRGRGRARSAERSGEFHGEQRDDRNSKKSGRDHDFSRGGRHGHDMSPGQGGRGRGFDRDRNWEHHHDTRGHSKGQNKRYDNKRERHNSGTESPMHEQSTSPRAGGLIKLPPSAPYMAGGPQDSAHFVAHEKRTEGGHSRDENRGGGNFRDKRGGGSGQRMLFDPKNPNKPIMIKDSNSGNSTTLKFQETGHDGVQGPPLTPPTPPGMYHPGFPPNYYGNYEQRCTEAGYPAPPPPPHLGYFGYPFPHPVPGVYRDNAMYHEELYHRDPYYQGDYDPEQTVSGRSRTQCRAMAERMFQEALPLDSQLTSLVSRRITGKEHQIMHQLRHDLQNKYEQIILLDLDVANKHNIEQLLWKSVYYQVIEVYRKHMAEEKEDETKTQLTKMLNEGTDFYERLLQKLQQTYNFQLDVFLDTSTLPPENVSRTVKLALLSMQRNLICLGDISRYREQNNDTGKVNYGRARSWYTKAQQIAPKNGRPYNQLAILALYTRRKLDAVYYYMRSLAASNPFLTARESLMSLFDEARKKSENSEKKREQERERMQKLKNQKQKHGERIEIWVSADGTSTQDKERDEGEDQLSKLDAVEINKRFVLSFLNVHGKLFTKIGRETFPEFCGQMLKEFQALLKHGAIGPTRLLQLMAINMFAIENTALKKGEYNDNFRSELQEHAVQLGLDMFGILVSRCSEQLLDHLKSEDYPAHMFSRELEELVPGMKVWVDWMFCHSYLWNPPPQLRDTSIGPDVDVWKSLAELCSILKDVDTSHVKLYKDKREGCDPVILSEDVMLSGFVPLLSLPQEVPYVHSTVDKEIAQDCSRINKLKDFGDYLCGIENPVLAFDVVSQKFYSIAPSTGYSEEEKGDFPSDDNSSEDEDVIIESEEEVHGEDDEHVRQLREKKEELKRKKQEREKQQENVKKILEKNKHRCIELEIHPIFLVPDTNCFIDHLQSLQKLIQDQKFTVTIPLVVINELDGLAKGSREGQYENKEHANKVKTRAGETVQYLEEEFEKKNSHLRAQTAKGNIMETIAFRSEETEADQGNNDDVILSCCLHYCKDKAREFMPKGKDEPVRLYRDVVLLTDDRNLCLKAHTCNVPVKDVPSFMKWAKVT